MNGVDELGRALRRSAGAVTGEGELPDMSAAAARAGLIDVAYTMFDSPVGTLLLAATERGLTRVAYVDGPEAEAVLQTLSARLSPRLLVAPRRLDPARRELSEYFDGARREFEVALDWQLASGFSRRVLQATTRVPYGQVASYSEMAIAAGSPRAVRAAGNALAGNPLPIVVPCHRIVRTGCGLGGYTGGLERKRALLALERRELPAW